MSAPSTVPVPPQVPRPGSLLVRLPGPLGDAVMATPALRALRAALPGSRITWAGGRAALEALDGLSARDAVLPLVGPFHHGLRAPWRAGRLLRRLRFDAALLLPNSFASALAVRLAGIPVRVGTARQRRGALLTHRLDLPPAPRSMREHYLDLVRPFGAQDDGRGTALAVTAFDAEQAQRRLAGLPAGTVLAGASPGAGFGPSKLLPPELLGAALRRLREEAGVLPLVLCGPGEERLAAAVAAATGEPCLSTHGAPPGLGELKGLLQRCRVLLASDAGPRHMAEALGVPTVVWAGPTDPRWGAGGGARVLQVEGLDCLACHLRRCPVAGHPCMTRLEPARLVEAARALLAPAPPAAPCGARPAP